MLYNCILVVVHAVCMAILGDFGVRIIFPEQIYFYFDLTSSHAVMLFIFVSAVVLVIHYLLLRFYIKREYLKKATVVILCITDVCAWSSVIFLGSFGLVSAISSNDLHIMLGKDAVPFYMAILFLVLRFTIGLKLFRATRGR